MTDTGGGAKGACARAHFIAVRVHLPYISEYGDRCDSVVPCFDLCPFFQDADPPCSHQSVLYIMFLSTYICETPCSL